MMLYSMTVLIVKIDFVNLFKFNYKHTKTIDRVRIHDSDNFVFPHPYFFSLSEYVNKCF